jgi:hypothetical protein
MGAAAKDLKGLLEGGVVKDLRGRPRLKRSKRQGSDELKGENGRLRKMGRC